MDCVQMPNLPAHEATEPGSDPMQGPKLAYDVAQRHEISNQLTHKTTWSVKKLDYTEIAPHIHPQVPNNIFVIQRIIDKTCVLLLEM